MREVTGVRPRMWGPTMIGFGPPSAPGPGEPIADQTWFTVGFAPRAAALTIDGIHDAGTPDPRLADLGPHTTGAGYVYVKRLDGIDLDLLRTLVGDAWRRASR